MLNKLTENVLNGISITNEQVGSILLQSDIDSLTKAADKIRYAFCGNKIDLCSIINGKCGRCSEDCKFCVQSHTATTELSSHSFIDYDTYINALKKAEELKINHYSVVTSGRTLSQSEYTKAISIYSEAARQGRNISQCASHGLLTSEQLEGLKAAGVTRYHANLETSERYFPTICTTHTYADKINLIKNAQRAGLDVCSGGIIGIGETMQDRIDMAFKLKELGIKSIPINIYLPISGTSLTDIPTPSYNEILTVIAIFRFINPDAQIRLAAGRKYMADNGLMAFKAGANAAITGDMLTTMGNSAINDIKMLTNNGFIAGV